MQQLNIQTDRHEKIVGNPVTRTSVAEFITKLILNPTDYIKQSVALSEK